MQDVSFRVDRGDKVGLVGRNGAGKTTLTKILAGEGQPASGSIDRTGEVGYLPQDPRSGNPDELARTRILDARGLGSLALSMRAATEDMGHADPDTSAAAMSRYSRLEDRFLALGGYAAEAEAASIASNLKLPDRILDQQLKTLSGGQRRRIELARILFSGAETMLLDEPTNHLDADSVVWLRDYLSNYSGGLIVISHDVALVESTVNRVFYLDANRQVIDIYKLTCKNYVRQREADEERRRL
jgi:ATPase subunit of ABC transporter with duplicated ATPase domains